MLYSRKLVLWVDMVLRQYDCMPRTDPFHNLWIGFKDNHQLWDQIHKAKLIKIRRANLKHVLQNRTTPTHVFFGKSYGAHVGDGHMRADPLCSKLCTQKGQEHAKTKGTETGKRQQKVERSKESK